VVATHGRTYFVEAIKEFEVGALDTNLLEVLCCDGCIMGAGMSSKAPMFSRRSEVSRYVRRRTRFNSEETWRSNIARFFDINMCRNFSSKDQRIQFPSAEELRIILEKLGKYRPEDELNCGACGYETCGEHAVAIHKGLAESEMCLPYTIEQLKSYIQQLADTNEELDIVERALVQSEKMASMGQMAAGIAHEVNNPLGVVLIYAHLLLDEHADDPEMAEDLKMIVEHADRSKGIISGLLNFARQKQLNPEIVDIRKLLKKLLKTVPVPDNISVVVEDFPGDPNVELDHDQIIQVFTNLYTNALVAMPDGGRLVTSFSGSKQEVSVSVQDTGVGIAEENIAKIFEPFYTTKKVGKGTGLGLAVSYGIIKMHRGKINVTSNTDAEQGPTGTRFSVTLPRFAEQIPDAL
jgi:signal transduction histidine kinase